MIKAKSVTGKILIGFTLTILLQLSNKVSAQDGKALFTQNCAACHSVHKKLTGPALAGVEDRWPDKQKLHDWIRNNTAVLQSGYPYAVKLFEEYNKTPMNTFPDLKDEDIEAILTYIKKESANVPQTATAATPSATEKPGDNSILFGVLTLILAIIVFILAQVNNSLKRLAAVREGQKVYAPVPFWRNKAVITLVSIILFLCGGFYLVKGAIGLGHTKDYEPKQPIFFSHKVHAGTNQINCLYCHTGAQEGKHSTIPSVNVCLNCHMAINEYTGKDKLYTAEGEEVNGSAEIQKLYDYAGYTPGQPWDASKAKPIEWVQVHNLPDHVYFNHSQHVVAGNVQCQTCHGDVTQMDEIKQFAPLTMGWCINCHRETEVNFKDNGFYSIYLKYHEQLKDGSKKGITVEDIGGTECQKCHY